MPAFRQYMLSKETVALVARARKLRGLQEQAPAAAALRIGGAREGGGSDGMSAFRGGAAPSLRTRRGAAAMAEALAVGKAEPIAAEVQALLEAIWSGRESVYDPMDLLRSVWTALPQFAGRNQEQDAHEFLQCALDAISRELRGETSTGSKRPHSELEPGIQVVDLTGGGVARLPVIVPAPRGRVGAVDGMDAFGADAGEDEALAGEEGFVVTSRWGPKRHAPGCVCRSCKRQRRELRAATKAAAGALAAASTPLRPPQKPRTTPTRRLLPSTRPIAPPVPPVDPAIPGALEQKPTLAPPSAPRRVPHAMESTPPPPFAAKLRAKATTTPPLSPTPRRDPMFALFGGVILSRTRCRHCGATTENREPFTDLSIPIPRAMRAPSACSGDTLNSGAAGGIGGGLAADAIANINRGGADATLGGVALEACLRAFSSSEELGGVHGYACSQCGSSSATKETEIVELPQILCLHLKRFECIPSMGGGGAAPTETAGDEANGAGGSGEAGDQSGGGDGASRGDSGGGGNVISGSGGGAALGGVIDKIDTAVTFPLSGLDVAPHTNSERLKQRSTVYDLCAVIKHHGERADSGHYTAMAHNTSTRQWLSFNDHKIEECRAADAENATRSYIFFYSRRADDRGA